jgi:hypothetical protein
MNTPIGHSWSKTTRDIDPTTQMTDDLIDISNVFNIDHSYFDNIFSTPNIDGNGFGAQVPQSQLGAQPSIPFDESMAQFEIQPNIYT